MNFSLSLLVLAIASSLAMSGCQFEPAAAPGAEAQQSAFSLSPCQETGVGNGLRCGRLSVPENPRDPRGRHIELNIVVAPAMNASEPPAGLFVLEGGPGVPATASAEFFVAEGSVYRDKHDVVLVDLRGTGDSNPLHCKLAEVSANSLQQHLSLMYPPAMVAGCRKALETKADLRQYTTSNAVEDLEAVRRALGYEMVDLQAISYGTRLALEYARRYPEHVRTLTAVGSLPPEHRVPLQHAAGFQRAFDLLLADCESDPDCSDAYPDLRERWTALLERMAEPVVYRFESDSHEDGGVDLTIRKDVFVEELRSAMYLATQARSLPLVIDAASRGNFDPFLAMALPSDPDAAPFLAEGAYLSFTCAEDVSRISAADVAQVTAGTYLGDYRVAQQIGACELWPRGAFPESLVSAVEAKVPALLVTGDRDPITPPSDARQMERWLPNSRVLIVPHAGHMPFDGSNPECIDGIMFAFLQSATLEDLDISCALANTPPPFVLN